MHETKIAWFAGLMDGEGSIGIGIERKPERISNPIYLSVAVQMSMTCKRTIDVAILILEEIGIRGLGYTHREKDPTKHQDAWDLRVNRLLDISILAPLMIPYAVTKKRQWELMDRYVQSRTKGIIYDERGRVIRGGNNARLYSAEEIAIAEELHILNARGVEAIRRNEAWQAKLKAVRQLKSEMQP